MVGEGIVAVVIVVDSFLSTLLPCQVLPLYVLYWEILFSSQRKIAKVAFRNA